VFHVTPLHASALVEIRRVDCCGHDEWPRREESNDHDSFAFPRQGAYVRRSSAGTLQGDANHVVFFAAGDSCTVHHPARGPDVSLSLRASPAVLHELMEGTRLEPGQLRRHAGARHDGRTQLALARLESALEGGEPGACDERALDALHGALGARTGIARGQVLAPAHRELAHLAAGRLAARHGARSALADVATDVGLSPFALLRAFRREFGVGVHGYAMRLRLSRALSLLRDPRPTLSTIALDLGFADQSHFTAAFRRWFDVPPGQARTTLR
jgi:AraC-like DNA-binding protein